MPSIDRVRLLVNQQNYSISKHAFIEAFADNFSVKDILYGISTGEIIEDYPERRRLLIYAKLKSRTMHIVVSYSTLDYIWIVTVYKPNQNEWINNKIRKNNR